MAPRDDEQARKSLCVLIARELARIGEIRETLQAIADADLAEAPARMAFETGDEGERHRRYVLANERVLNRRFTLLLEARKKSEAGTCRPSSPVGGPLSVGSLGPFDRPCLDRGEVVEPDGLASLSVVSGPSSVVDREVEALEEPPPVHDGERVLRNEAVSVVLPVGWASPTDASPRSSDASAPTSGVRGPTAAHNDERVPRNEQFVSSPLSVVSCEVAVLEESPVPVGDSETAAPLDDARAHGDDEPTPSVNGYGGTNCGGESFVRNEAIVNRGAPRKGAATARDPPD